MPKSSSLGFKGFSGNIEVSNLNQARGRRRPRTCTEKFSTKITNVAVLGPMDVYTNVIHQKRMPQLKAKFTACNLVCTEAMPMTKFAPSLDSYESLGVNVGKNASKWTGVQDICCYAGQLSPYCTNFSIPKRIPLRKEFQ